MPTRTARLVPVLLVTLTGASVMSNLSPRLVHPVPHTKRTAAGECKGESLSHDAEGVSALACISALTTLGMPVAAAQTSGRRPDLRLQKGETLVMIGDSITDVGRARPIGGGERTMRWGGAT